MAKAPCKGCKKSEEECEECPEWIFTFADLVMLMMGFFVILWVLKPNPGKEGAAPKPDLPVEVVAAIRGAFGYMPDPKSKDPVDMHMLLEKLGQMKMPQGTEGPGKTLLPKKGAEGSDPEVITIRKGTQAIVGGRLMFDQGDAKLLPDTMKVCNQIAVEIRGHRNIVLIKGHTSVDDLPPSATAEEKMALSLKRAQTVADYLVKNGVEPDILRVQGCSIFEPVSQHAYQADARALNRRVEVEATATLVEDLQDRTGEGAAEPKKEGTTQEPKAPVEHSAEH